VAEHHVGCGEITDQVLAALERRVNRGERPCQELPGLTEGLLVPAVGRQQDGLHDDRVDRRHDHALAVVEPLKVLRELGGLDRGLQTAVAVARHHVLDDRAGLVDRDVPVLEYGNAAQGVPLAVLVRLQILRVEGHLVQVVLEPQLFQQPDDAARP
jgi:hypothetical protein